MNSMLTAVVPALSNLQNTILQQWIGPIFLVAIAVFAIVFIKDRAWMKLVSFVGIAAVVAIFIYAGPAIFGENGALKKVAEGTATQVESGGGKGK